MSLQLLMSTLYAYNGFIWVFVPLEFRMVALHSTCNGGNFIDFLTCCFTCPVSFPRDFTANMEALFAFPNNLKRKNQNFMSKSMSSALCIFMYRSLHVPESDSQHSESQTQIWAIGVKLNLKQDNITDCKFNTPLYSLRLNEFYTFYLYKYSYPTCNPFAPLLRPLVFTLLKHWPKTKRKELSKFYLQIF